VEQNDELPITVLQPKQQRFIQLYMTGQYSVAKLADLLELHPNTLWTWLRREDVKTIISDMQTDTHEMVANQMKALTLKAANRMSSLMDSPIDGVALAACKDVLDRSGHKPKQEIKVDKTITTVEERLKEIIDLTLDDYEIKEEE